MKSLKTKFVLGIVILITFTIGATGFFVISKQISDIKDDIYVSARNFAELTVSSVVDSYELYYTTNSYAYFRRDVSNIFSLNGDIERIQVVDFNGKILYDSVEEEYEQYSGDERSISDFSFIQRLQDIKPSVQTDSRIVYLKKDSTDYWRHMDRFENALDSIDSSDDIVNIVYPAGDNKTRVVYYVSYDALYSRVWATTERVLLILLLISIGGVFLGMMLSGRIIRPIKTLIVGTGEIAKGNLKYQVHIKTNDEIESLANSFNKMAHDLEISTAAMIEKEKIEKELDIARDIQMDLLPKEIPDIAGLDIAVSVTPATQVGGDCYDFLKLDDDNHLIYVGDVTGHGVPAGLVVAIANSLFFTLMDYYDNTKDIVIATNKIIKAKTRANMFLTAVLCNWEEKKKEFTYTSAGHEQMVLYKAKDKSVSLCDSGGMALGMLPDISALVKQQTVEFEIGDFLVLYTDGIPEAWKNKDEMLGMDGFSRYIARQDSSKSAQEIHDSIIKMVDDFRGGYEQMDDITLMIIKRVE